MPSYRATGHFHCGIEGIVAPGDPVPDTYTDSLGDQQPVDVDRLLDAGLIETVAPAGASKAASAPKGAPRKKSSAGSAGD